MKILQHPPRYRLLSTTTPRSPRLVGACLVGVLSCDSRGCPAVVQSQAVGEEGIWFVYLFTNLFINYQSIYLTIKSTNLPFIYLSIHRSIYLSIHLSIYLSIYLSVDKELFRSMYIYVPLCMWGFTLIVNSQETIKVRKM